MRIVILIIGTLLLRPYNVGVNTHRVCHTQAHIHVKTLLKFSIFIELSSFSSILSLYPEEAKTKVFVAPQLSSHCSPHLVSVSLYHALKCTKETVLLSQIYSISIHVRILSVFLFGFRIISCINPMPKYQFTSSI